MNLFKWNWLFGTWVLSVSDTVVVASVDTEVEWVEDAAVPAAEELAGEKPHVFYVDKKTKKLSDL